MDELKTAERAKQYIDAMARGLDPLSGEALAEDNFINQVRITRCLYYVSDILRQVIENGGSVGKHKSSKQKRVNQFILSEELKSKVEFDNDFKPITSITSNINKVIPEDMKKISYQNILSWLLNEGFINISYNNEKKYYSPTLRGEKMGIKTEFKQSHSGHSYYVTYYSIEMQKYIVEHINEIPQ